MSDASDYAEVLSKYAGSEPQVKRRKAVAAALSLLDAHANGASDVHPTVYAQELGPLVDAIEKAMEKQ